MSLPTTSYPSPLSSLPPAVLVSLGERLASAALVLLQEPALSDTARQAAQGLEALGVELQSLVHALGVQKGQMRESVPLLEAAQAARRQWLPELRRRGLTLRVEGEVSPLKIDPAQVQHALDLLIAHGLAGGEDIALRVLPALAPDRGAVVELSGAGSGPDPAELHGQLLTWLALANSWSVVRPPPEAGAWRLRVQLGEPADDIDPFGLPRRHWSPQDRVLVIEPDERTRLLMAQLLRQAGLRGDCVANLVQAERALRDGDPRSVVSGIPLQDPEGRKLFDPLRQRLPGLRWIELVEQPHLFTAGSADGMVPTRLSRSDLAHTLLAALAD